MSDAAVAAHVGHGDTVVGAEVCDEVDNDCNGLVDDVEDEDGDGWTTCDGDCDDTDPGSYPGAEEVCDGADNDCNEIVDDVEDVDADGWTTCDGDCDDADPSANPAATEVCDGVDNDCSGEIDDLDDDADGWTTCDGDCRDDDASVYPGADETCDDVDDDCDGQVDEGLPIVGGFGEAGDLPDFSRLGSKTEVTLYGIRSTGAADFNGDGVHDFGVGGYGGSQPFDVWYGSATSPLSAAPNWTATADATVREFGQMAAAGDVNGDGKADLVIGAADQAHVIGGAVRAFLGSSSGLGSSYAWQVRSTNFSEEFGYSVAVADVTGDGIGDVIVGSRARLCVFAGAAAPALPSTTGTCTVGWAAFPLVGRFNGDAHADIAYYSGTLGGTLVAYGGPGGFGPGVFLAAGYANENGDRAQDYDRDGFDDVVLGGTGAARLYRGGLVGVSNVASWTSPGSADITAHPGDLDGDGAPDLVYSVYGGNFEVVLNTGSGLGAAAEPLRFGPTRGLAGVGDVTGDGVRDLVVGNYQFDSEHGRFDLFFGREGLCVP